MTLSKSVKLFFWAFSLFLCVLFYRPIAEGMLGCALKVFLRFQNDCHFAYRSLRWEEGKFHFLDVVFFDLSKEQSTFHTFVEELELVFHWNLFPKKLCAHLTLHRPVIALRKERNWN